MNQRSQTYAYNFNPRETPKQLKLRFMIRQGVLHRSDIPAGSIIQNEKFNTKCKESYISYEKCLQQNMFDRQICRNNESQVVECEYKNNLHPNNKDVIAKLRLGLERSQKRKQQNEIKLKEKYENYSKKNVDIYG